MLIYIVRLTLQSTMDITIDNQCSSIALTSLVYFIKDETCHIQFPQQVNSKSIMKTNFITGVSQDTLGGALLYHIKYDASTCIQLLVIWGCFSDGIYSNACIIEHESTFVWDKDKLKKFHDDYNSRYDKNVNEYDVYCDIERWLLNDNTILKMKCKTFYSGLEMKIIISEDKSLLSFGKPLRLDPKR
jgi:hypothetical protein